MIGAEEDDRNRLAPYERLLSDGAARLRHAGVSDPQRDARLLMRWASGLDGAALAAARGETCDPAAAARFEAAVAARVERRPVSHIVGGRAFYGRWFQVSADVLDPRPESELLVALGIAHLRAAAASGRALDADAAVVRVLDLGVGSGCLLLSVLAEIAPAMAVEGVGVDLSPAALAVGRANAAALGLHDRTRWREGDWLHGVEGSFDLVLCNPPYIPEAEYVGLAPEVRDWEPKSALSPGADGLWPYRRIAPTLAPYLASGALALFEVGRGQAATVADLFASEGFRTQIHADLAGAPRVVAVETPFSLGPPDSSR